DSRVECQANPVYLVGRNRAIRVRHPCPSILRSEASNFAKATMDTTEDRSVVKNSFRFCAAHLASVDFDESNSGTRRWFRVSRTRFRRARVRVRRSLLQ